MADGSEAPSGSATPDGAAAARDGSDGGAASTSGGARDSAAADGATLDADAARARVAGMHGVFVVGVARSGTSLLKALLDGHPELWVPPAESMAVDWCDAPDPAAAFLALPKYDALLPAGSDERALVEAMLRERVHPGSGPVVAVRAFLEAMARVRPPQDSARRWVEKTPKHLRAVPTFLSALGRETRVVCVVRDPRAVLASQAKRWERGRTPEGMRHFARRWATGDVLTHDFLRRHPQFTAVRYEDLVAEPERVMRDVATHLDILWDDVLVQPTRGGVPWGGNSSFGTEGAPAGISAVSLKRYEKELRPDVVAGLCRLLAPRMTRWGYDPECRPAGPRRWLLELSTARAVRREQRGWGG